MRLLRILVVDDEPLGRIRIRTLLDDQPGIKVVDECTNGREAIAFIREERPDIIFLDIQMPGMDGFEMLTHLGSDELPLIIFATAYDEYALRAFDAHALDYLLKPFDRDRFYESLDRARHQIEMSRREDYQDRIQETAVDVLSSREIGTNLRFFVRTMGRILVIETDTIDWISAAGNYAELHVNGKRHLLRETMTVLEKKLPADRFRRVHRSSIINVECLVSIDTVAGGGYRLTLKDGSSVMASRGYRSTIRSLMDQ